MNIKRMQKKHNFKMKTGWSLLFLVALMLPLNSCSDEDKDDIYPNIDMTGDDAFPVNCSVLHPGDTFTFRALFTDNEELDAFSLEFHDNFDHHTHSTDVVDCEMEPDKEPINPFQLIEEYNIPPGLTSYEAAVDVSIPEDVDTGDYHFMVRLTDASGWQSLKGIAIKILPQE